MNNCPIDSWRPVAAVRLMMLPALGALPNAAASGCEHGRSMEVRKTSQLPMAVVVATRSTIGEMGNR